MSDTNTDADQKVDGHFFGLVAAFEAAAMQQLGKIAHPLTGEEGVDLAGARESIDTIEMLKRKTEGNLTSAETRFIDHALYQLRMNYVDVAKSQGAAAQGRDESEIGAEGGEGGGEEAAMSPGDGSEATRGGERDGPATGENDEEKTRSATEDSQRQDG